MLPHRRPSKAEQPLGLVEPQCCSRGGPRARNSPGRLVRRLAPGVSSGVDHSGTKRANLWVAPSLPPSFSLAEILFHSYLYKDVYPILLMPGLSAPEASTANSGRNKTKFLSVQKSISIILTQFKHAGPWESKGLGPHTFPT